MEGNLRITLIDVLAPINQSSIDCEVICMQESYDLPKLQPLNVELGGGEIEFMVYVDGLSTGYCKLDLQSYFEKDNKRTEVLEMNHDPHIQLQVSLMFSPKKQKKGFWEDRKIVEENKNLKKLIAKSYQSRNELQILVKESNDQLNQQISVLNQKLKDVIRERDELYKRLNELEKREETLKYQDRFVKLSAEKDAYYQELSRMRYEFHNLETQIIQTESNNEELKRKNLKYKEDIKGLKKQIESLLEMINRYKQSSEADYEKMSILQTENTALQSELLSKKSETSAELFKTQEELRVRTSEADRLFREKEEAYTEIAKIEQYLCVTEDIQQMADELREQNKMSELSNQKLMDELISMSDIISFQSRRNQNNVEKIKDLTKEIYSLEDELEELRTHKNFYHPVKDDPIDEALASFLNSRIEAMPVTFVREDVGVYSFGTKRVFIKLEQGKLIIRVGGGFMLIDEFLDTYMPIEIDKRLNESTSSTKSKTVREQLSTQFVPVMVMKKK